MPSHSLSLSLSSNANSFINYLSMILPPSPEMTSSSSSAIESLLHVIISLITNTIQIKTFTSRWHSIRSLLLSLSTSLASSNNTKPHPLLTQTLIPNIEKTLTRINTLAEICAQKHKTQPKLLMQSDLDMAKGWLDKQVKDLQILIKSGVINKETEIVLANPNKESTKEEIGGFVREVFARLQIGGESFKKKSLQSLVSMISENQKWTSLVAEEGNIGYLVNLMDLNGSNGVVLDLAITVAAALACGGEVSRRRLFDEGGLGPLLRIVESGPAGAKEKAAAAVEAIAGDADSIWALSAYGGVPALVEACRAGNPAVQAHVAGAMRNVAVREEARAALAEEGAAPVLLQVLAAGNPAAQEKAAECIAVLASSDDVWRSLIKKEDGLVRLMDVLREDPGPVVAEHILRAVYALLSSDHKCCRVLSSSAVFVVHVAEMIMHGNVHLQRICCLLLSSLSLSDEKKRSAARCMAALLKLMESSKPDGMQEEAAWALVSLLSVRLNRKDLVKDEKCLVRLVNMLDPRQDTVAKELAVMVTGAVLAGGSEGCRKRVGESGAHQHLQKLAEMGVAGAKKAVQRLSGNRLKSLFSRTWRELPGK